MAKVILIYGTASLQLGAVNSEVAKAVIAALPGIGLQRASLVPRERADSEEGPSAATSAAKEPSDSRRVGSTNRPSPHLCIME